VISKFFIDRPIFASVMSLVITLAGGIALFSLPITQYPNIAPPTVEVFASYPGANAQVVSDTVGSPIEQRVNGVEGMMYMSSQCANNGDYTLTVTFAPGTDLNLAQILVQNQVALAQPTLPELVRRRGVTVKKKSPSVLMIVNLYSPDGSRDNLYLSNYATIQLRDELSRVTGVGDITFLGQRDYSMRVWVNPEEMAARQLSASDLIRSVEQQNVQVATGQIGQPPAPNGQVFQYTMSTLGRLSDPTQFADMILKSDAQRIVRVKDVSRIELGAQAYEQVCTLDRKPSVAMSIFQLPGSNALEVAKTVQAKMDELAVRFPNGVAYSIVYDTSPFILESIHEVYGALRDAILLVALVVLIFLQGWRAAVIPLVAVPVAVIGTFAVMAALGYSLNTLTLFGLVLAIGIVVDDAIVVVEAIEHHIESGMSSRDAAILAMEQVSGPVIAVALVLSAVFVPCIFITGIVGQFFRQFAVTIAISTLISAFNSLTLSPALAVLLLKPGDKREQEALPRWLMAIVFGGIGYAVSAGFGGYFAAGAGVALGWFGHRLLNRFLSGFFIIFNAWFHRVTDRYVNAVEKLLRRNGLVLTIYLGLLGLTYLVFHATPTGFVPSQDKGYLLVNVQLPAGASLDRTVESMAQIEDACADVPGVAHTLSIAGQSLLNGAKAPNCGSMYVMLDSFPSRTKLGLSSSMLARQIEKLCERTVDDGQVVVVGAPPIEGLGMAGGLKLVLEDRSDLGGDALSEFAERTVSAARAAPGLSNVFASNLGDTPWYEININRTLAKTLGVSLQEVFTTLQVYCGSLYVNDFNRFGRTWQVNVQADSAFRTHAEDLTKIKLRNDRGGMVPFSTIASVQTVPGPIQLTRYNLYPAVMLTADPDASTSSGQVIATLDQTASQQSTPGMRSEWTELAALQSGVAGTTMTAFALSVVLVFLVLAAQYESWSLPLAVILVVPLCLLCSLSGVLLARLDVNIFTQIGFVVLVGLACKNAILIVEFARSRRATGASPADATIDACRLRLRPIVMTSLAFILGVVPLMVGTGAGAEMRRTLGTAVFFGMLGVTIFGVVLTPVFYYVVQGAADRWAKMRQS
jgi:multidrug efflux pump subunit AcrB